MSSIQSAAPLEPFLAYARVRKWRQHWHSWSGPICFGNLTVSALAFVVLARSPLYLMASALAFVVWARSSLYLITWWHQSWCWCSCCLGAFVVVLDGVGVGIGSHAGLGAFIIVLDGLGRLAVVLDVALVLVLVMVFAHSLLHLMALVLVLACLLLYLMVSVLGWVLACSLYLLIWCCQWCWCGHFWLVGLRAGIGPFVTWWHQHGWYWCVLRLIHCLCCWWPICCTWWHWHRSWCLSYQLALCWCWHIHCYTRWCQGAFWHVCCVVVLVGADVGMFVIWLICFVPDGTGVPAIVGLFVIMPIGCV